MNISTGQFLARQMYFVYTVHFNIAPVTDSKALFSAMYVFMSVSKIMGKWLQISSWNLQIRTATAHDHDLWPNWVKILTPRQG